jgi:hypothetical protein
VKYDLQMYVLDDYQIPKNPIFSAKFARCLAITYNIAWRNRKSFDFFGELSPHVQRKFNDNFERHLRFHYSGWSKTRIVSADAEVAMIWFRLVYSTWERIWGYNCNEAFCEKGLLLTDGDTPEYATNNHYLSEERDQVTNEEIVDFCWTATHSVVYSATAMGFKNIYDVIPKGYVNIAEKDNILKFARKGIQLIEKSLMDKFNTGAYPDWLTNHTVFRHSECPIIFGVDVGLEVSPMEQDTSFLPNGFAMRKYLLDMSSVTIDSVTNPNPRQGITGKPEFFDQ